MSKAFPEIIESVEQLEALLKAERDGNRQRRLELLWLIQSGQVGSRVEAGKRLFQHRHTISNWLSAYQQGGLAQLLERRKKGPKGGQRQLSDEAYEALQNRLADRQGFASYGQIQQWLWREWGQWVKYSTLHHLVRYELKAKLKSPRPSHSKKIPPRKLISANASPTA